MITAMTAGHKIEAITVSRTHPVIFEITVCLPAFSARLPVNLGSMMIPRMMTTITRISDMMNHRFNVKMGFAAL